MVQAALDAIAKLNNMEVGAKRIQVHHTRYDFTQNLFLLVSLVLLLCIYLSGKRCLLSIPIHGGLCGQFFVIFQYNHIYNNASSPCREVCMCENRKDTPNANGGSLSSGV